MFTIAIVNQKGGSGKSTLTQCLAVAAMQDDWAAAILDLDPQGTAYSWKKRRKDPNPPVLSVTEANFRDEHEKLEKLGADLVIIDTPARLRDTVMGASELADLVLVPSKPTINDIERIDASVKLASINGQKPVLVVFNQVPPQKARAEEAEAAVTGQQYPVCPVRIGQRMAFVDAVLSGQTPLETEPRSKAAEEISALYQHIKQMLTGETVDKSTSGQEVVNG